MKRAKIHRRRGNAVIEAALILPVLLMLAFGVVEYGYFFYVKKHSSGRRAGRRPEPPSCQAQPTAMSTRPSAPP